MNFNNTVTKAGQKNETENKHKHKTKNILELFIPGIPVCNQQHHHNFHDKQQQKNSLKYFQSYCPFHSGT